jgi:hypothetical protein
MTLLAQVRLKSLTGLSRDDAVNTFHFDGGDDPEDVLSALVYFYDDNGAGFGRVGLYLSEGLSRTANAHEIRIYDLTDPTPRSPIASRHFTLPAQGAGPGLPAQVSCALSYHGTIPNGANFGPGPHLPARHRGRIFLGPLQADATLNGLGVPTGRFNTTFLDDVRDAGQALRDDANTQWVVYSPTGGFQDPVIGGWVDDSPDVIRRRKLDDVARYTF